MLCRKRIGCHCCTQLQTCTGHIRSCTCTSPRMSSGTSCSCKMKTLGKRFARSVQGRNQQYSGGTLHGLRMLPDRRRNCNPLHTFQSQTTCTRLSIRKRLETPCGLRHRRGRQLLQSTTKRTHRVPWSKYPNFQRAAHWMCRIGICKRTRETNPAIESPSIR